MSAFPPPTNGFYTGATYNSLYFVDSDTSTVTKEYLEENYLPRVGNPIDVAESATWEGELILEDDVLMEGTTGTQGIVFPNGVKQFYAMKTFPASQTYSYTTVTTDAKLRDKFTGIQYNTRTNNPRQSGIFIWYQC